MTAHALIVSPLYIGIFALVLIAFGARIIILRNVYKVAFGDGGHPDLEVATRIFGNFIEYVPIALLLIVALEATGSSRYIIHALGLTLLIGRLIHAGGLGMNILAGRALGVLLTYAVLAIGGVLAILAYIRLISVV